MPLRVLVTGLLAYDSGKTWLAASILEKARSEGIEAAGYKPVGGFSAWYDYARLADSVGRCLLAGGDAATLSSITGDRVEALNPVAYTTTVPVLDPRYVARYVTSMDQLDKMLAIWRLTSCRRPGYVSKHYYSRLNISSSPPPLRQLLLEAAARLNAEPGDPREFLEAVGSREWSEELEACRVAIEQGKKLVVIESFNNSAVPYQGLDLCSIDFYLVVSPGTVLLYPGERVCRAAEVVGGLTRTDKLLPLLSQPLLVEYLPPAGSREELAEKLSGSRLLQLLLAR